MKDAFWGQIFCLLSAGGATIETIRQYIESVPNFLVPGISFTPLPLSLLVRI